MSFLGRKYVDNLWGQFPSLGFLLDLIPYVPINNLSVMSGRVFTGWNISKQGLMCLALGHNGVTPVRLEPTALLSRVKNSTTEPLRSLINPHLLLYSACVSMSEDIPSTVV